MTKLDTKLGKVEEMMGERVRQADANSPEKQERQRRYFALSDSVLDVLVRVSEWLLALEGDTVSLGCTDWRYQWSWLGLPEGQGVPPLTKQQATTMTTAIEDFAIGVPPMSGDQLLGRLRAVVPGIPAEGLT